MTIARANQFLALVVAAVVFGACSGSSPAASTGSSAPTGPASFTVWTTPTLVNLPGFEAQTKNGGDWDKLLATQYMAAHPNVKIDVQLIAFTDAQTKMAAAVSAGQPPDVYFDADTRETQWAAKNLVENISTLVPDVWARINPGMQKNVTVAGVPYGIPMYASPGNFVKVNTTIFDAAGVTVPADGVWTYPQFQDALTKIAQPGKLWPIAMRMNNEQGDYDWFGYLWGFGCKAFSADNKTSNMSSPECVKGIQWIVDAAKKGWLVPGTTTIQPADVDTAYYGTGQVAIAYGRADLANREKTLQSQGKIQAKVSSTLVLFPYDTAAPGLITFLGSYEVFKQTDPAKKAAIADFLRFITTKDKVSPALQAGGSLSTFTDVPTPGTDPQFLKVVGWYDKYGVFDWGATIPVFNQIRQKRVAPLQAAILGQMSAADAAKAIDDIVNPILASQ